MKRVCLCGAPVSNRVGVCSACRAATKPPGAIDGLPVHRSTVAIPISAGKRIAEEYGYEQVIIIGRKTGPGGREHVTTYGVNKAHCDVAAHMGNFLKHKIMGWPQE